MPDPTLHRRKLLRRCLVGGGGLVWGACALRGMLTGEPAAGLRLGFHGDAPATLWAWSREADWYEVQGALVHCTLCPHECILGPEDRGFCRVRVVKGRKLHTLVYGNPCAVHVDPVEKKPLNHFLPGTPILSLATAGCNLRCINCQNDSISQAKPEETDNLDLPPERVVRAAAQNDIPSLAYTYSEPVIFYEYVRDTAARARELGIRNVLVTAGYIREDPLRQLCRVVDAANVDLKGFSDRFYRTVTGGRLAPVLRSLEVMREEGVWVEVTRLLVPVHSDDIADVGRLSRWLVQNLGPGTPLHLSRFHPAYRLRDLPPTPLDLLEDARKAARDAGLHHVYVGNVPGFGGEDTVCPSCGEIVLARRGYEVTANRLVDGACPCGEPIPGVWS